MKDDRIQKAIRLSDNEVKQALEVGNALNQNQLGPSIRLCIKLAHNLKLHSNKKK